MRKPPAYFIPNKHSPLSPSTLATISLFLAFIFFVGVPKLAFANNQAAQVTAEEFTRILDLERKGKFTKALELLEKAETPEPYEAHRTNVILAIRSLNIAQGYEKGNVPGQAENTLEATLSNAFNPVEDFYLIQTLQQALLALKEKKRQFLESQAK